MSPGRRASFVIRAVEDGSGRLSGIIERVATGAKEAFRGTEAVGEVMQRMLRRESTLPEAGASPSATDGNRGPTRRRRRGRPTSGSTTGQGENP
jgi:hypothetical protein